MVTWVLVATLVFFMGLSIRLAFVAKSALQGQSELDVTCSSLQSELREVRRDRDSLAQNKEAAEAERLKYAELNQAYKNLRQEFCDYKTEVIGTQQKLSFYKDKKNYVVSQLNSGKAMLDRLIKEINEATA